MKWTRVCDTEGCSLVAGDNKFLTNYVHLKYKTVAHLDFFNVLARMHNVKWTVCEWFRETAEDQQWFILYHRLPLEK